jgi:hypothetical protein
MIDKLLTMENKGPSTVHDPRLVFHREKFLSGYRSARGGAFDEAIARDQFDAALLYMAHARAYFQRSHLFLSHPASSPGSLTVLIVAFVRFTDAVPMMIDQELLRGLDWDRGLTSALTKGLGVTGPGSFEKAREYLQEPPDVRSRREGLLRKRERLHSARRELQSI